MEPGRIVANPNWGLWIILYFYFGGIAAGAYFIGTLIDLFGIERDRPIAKLAYYLAAPLAAICGLLLIVDLTRPERFWHMIIQSNTGLPMFKYWSPMSVGAWALVVFGAIATVSVIEAWLSGRRDPDRASLLRDGVPGKVWTVVGGLFGLFVASYTGVLLAVSNQPVWSDTWLLGGLFLASALSGSVALLGWLASSRRDARASAPVFVRAERFYPALEVALLVVFVVTLIPAGALGQAFGFPWILLWLVALVGLVPGLTGRFAAQPAVAGRGEVAVGSAVATVATLVVLLGVLALRAAVIFSAQ